MSNQIFLPPAQLPQTIQPNPKDNATSNKKLKKEERLKEIKRYCELVKSNNVSSKRLNERVRHHANEFLKKCKSTLSEEQFRELIINLANLKYQNYADKNSQNEFVKRILTILKSDSELKARFSAFLATETSLPFDLFNESLFHEKASEFLAMLEIFMPNKCSHKRVLQMIINSCSSNFNFNKNNNLVLKERQKQQQELIISDIKTKLKTITKNNRLINAELDHLFDSQMSNTTPKYEKMSLVGQLNEGSNVKATASESVQQNFDYEFIDLAKDNKSSLDYGSKRCTCPCHCVLNASENAIEEPDNSLQSLLNHCFLCSLKIIKGKLYLKCEGKKAIPLDYQVKSITKD